MNNKLQYLTELNRDKLFYKNSHSESIKMIVFWSLLATFDVSNFFGLLCHNQKLNQYTKLRQT